MTPVGTHGTADARRDRKLQSLGFTVQLERYHRLVSHPSIAPPPGFDELSTAAKVDYVNSLWERVVETDNPESPDRHRDLVRAEIEAQQLEPDATADWSTARADILRQLERNSR